MSQTRLRLLCAGALMLLAQLAHAQYAWIDDKGTRVFSDRPPPPGTPANRILKAPRQAGAAQFTAPGQADSASAPASTSRAPASTMPTTPTAPTAAGASANAGAAASAGAGGKTAPPTLAEREADFRKRAAERADSERKARDEAERKVAQAEQCASARQQERQMTSGVRIARVNERGEREFLSDAQKAQELARARRALADCR